MQGVTTARFPGHEQDAHRAKIEEQLARLRARYPTITDDVQLRRQFALEALNPATSEAWGGDACR